MASESPASVTPAKGNGGNASGVAGIFNGTSGTGSGVIGISLAPKGAGVSGQANSSTGVSGITGGSSGVGGYFDNTAAGNIIIGAVNGTHKFRVDGTGKGFFDGGTQTGGADFAESVAIAGDRSLRGPGDLLIVDATATRQLALATQPYSTLVAGIYSTKPGVLATPHCMDEIAANEIPLGYCRNRSLQSQRREWTDPARRLAGEFIDCPATP